MLFTKMLGRVEVKLRCDLEKFRSYLGHIGPMTTISKQRVLDDGKSVEPAPDQRGGGNC